MLTLELMQHQINALEFLEKRNGRAALFVEMGLGKTIIAAKYIENLPGYKTLVVCPKSLIKSAWMHDVTRFTGLTVCNLRDGVHDADIYICNYEFILQEKNFKAIEKMVSNGRWIAVLDESSRIKNHRSKTAQILLDLRKYFEKRIILTATPAPNNEMEYWPQIKFISDDVFSGSFYAFRNKYFHLQNPRGQVRQGSVFSKEEHRKLMQYGFKYTMTDAKRADLVERISHVSFIASKEKWLDLPEASDEIRLVEMTPEQKRLHNDMKRHAIAEIREQMIPANVALTKIMKLRQITSGFLINPEGENIPLQRSPKLDELLATIEQMGAEQVIIWCQFKWEIETLAKVLPDCVTLYSQTKDQDESIRAFKSGEARFLIAHPKSAGHGLTFINCRYQIFYSLDYSWETYFQARGRVHRIGQTKNCVYVHLICENSIDEVLLSALKRKEDAAGIMKEFET